MNCVKGLRILSSSVFKNETTTTFSIFVFFIISFAIFLFLSTFVQWLLLFAMICLLIAMFALLATIFSFGGY